jgi:hypothetical protein
MPGKPPPQTMPCPGKKYAILEVEMLPPVKLSLSLFFEWFAFPL